jgi:hypothetical protein
MIKQDELPTQVTPLAKGQYQIEKHSVTIGAAGQRRTYPVKARIEIVLYDDLELSQQALSYWFVDHSKIDDVSAMAFAHFVLSDMLNKAIEAAEVVATTGN